MYRNIVNEFMFKTVFVMNALDVRMMILCVTKLLIVIFDHVRKRSSLTR